MKAIKVKGGVVIPCQGCRGAHIVPDTWTFNGDVNCPTFTPSLKVFYPDNHPVKYCCHSVITNGVMAYCGDCTHELAGQSVPLRDFTAEEIEMYNSPGYQT